MVLSMPEVVIICEGNSLMQKSICYSSLLSTVLPGLSIINKLQHCPSPNKAQHTKPRDYTNYYHTDLVHLVNSLFGIEYKKNVKTSFAGKCLQVLLESFAAYSP